MKRMGLDPFKELLRLVANRQNNDVEEDGQVMLIIMCAPFIDVFYSKVTNRPVPSACIFCGLEFPSARAQTSHLKVIVQLSKILEPLIIDYFLF